MLLSLFAVLLIAIVAYFNYLQGLFSAGLSAILAVIAAIIAMAYHENVVSFMNGGKLAEQANSIALVITFSMTYIILRTIFDKAIPGNLRFPVMVDKIGAGLFGLVAAIMAVGILMIAAQALPFTGPSIAGHSRYDVTFERKAQIRIAGKDQVQDTQFDELDAEKWDKDEHNSLWIPADDIVQNLTMFVSDASGPLSNGKPFRSYHPDYLRELFGQRNGYQSGSKRTGLAKKTSVIGIFTAPQFREVDPERLVLMGSGIGVRGPNTGHDSLAPLPPVKKPDANKMLLVVRARLHRDDSDPKANSIAFSLASVRLVFDDTNYFPIGTLEKGQVLYVQHPDDYMYASPDKAVDFVFEVPEAAAPLNPQSGQRAVAANVFFEFKRLGYVSIENLPVGSSVPDGGAEVDVIRKQGTEGAASDTTVGGARQVTGPLEPDTSNPPMVSAKLFSPLNVGGAGDEVKDSTMVWGKFSLKGGKFSMLEVEPTQTVKLMAQGPKTIGEFAAPERSAVVQVNCRPSSNFPNKWAWANLMEFRLDDASSNHFKPMGVVAKVKNAQGQDFMFAQYDMNRAIPSVAPATETRPTDVTFLFVVPSGTELKGFYHNDELVVPMQLKVP